MTYGVVWCCAVVQCCAGVWLWVTKRRVCAMLCGLLCDVVLLCPDVGHVMLWRTELLLQLRHAGG